MNRHRKIERSAVSPPASDEPARTGIVVPFPSRGARPTRPAPVSGESRGQILLFLGVRYERLAS
ncbi:MAG: hypothetical protein ABW058_13475 [Methylobacterium sp.]